MNCIKCYQEIPDGAKFCPYCGAQQSDTSATDPVRAEETVTEPVQAAQTEEVPTEPVQAAQTEEVPTEPVQAAQTEEALTEPVQPTQTEEVRQNRFSRKLLQRITYIRKLRHRRHIHPHRTILITEQVRLILIRRQISSMEEIKVRHLTRTRCLIRIRRRRRRSTGYRTLYYLLFVRCAVVFRSVS